MTETLKRVQARKVKGKMKHQSIVAAVSAVLCLWVACSHAFADNLVWQTSRATAVSMATTQGKHILLFAGRESCSNCQYMKYTACESTSPAIKDLIEKSFIPWFSDVDNSTEWGVYADGLGGFALPLICVIDLQDSDSYLDRTTGVQDLQVFYSRLLQYTTCTLSISPSFHVCNDSSHTGTINVTASSSNCSWTALSNASWITITAGDAGTGNGTVSYSVSENTTGSTRIGTMTIAGSTFTVMQRKLLSLPALQLLLE
jgi:hypothetical protein